MFSNTISRLSIKDKGAVFTSLAAGVIVVVIDVSMVVEVEVVLVVDVVVEVVVVLVVVLVVEVVVDAPGYKRLQVTA